MQKSTSPEDAVIHIAALKAARDAAEHMAKQSANSNVGTAGAFALYTWGSLAFMSALFALALGFYPSGMNFDPFTVASINTTPTHLTTNQAVGNIDPGTTDPIHTGNISVGGIIEKAAPANSADAGWPAANNEMTDALNVAEPKVITLQPDPTDLLPQIIPPNADILMNKLSPALDPLSTGSVNSDPASDSQPYPGDEASKGVFAVDLGGAKAVSPLINRYLAIKRRAPDLFIGLEPRIQLSGVSSDLEARLVAGPFASRSNMARFCRAVRLRLTIDCSPSLFDGETIQ